MHEHVVGHQTSSQVDLFNLFHVLNKNENHFIRYVCTWIASRTNIHKYKIPHTLPYKF